MLITKSPIKKNKKYYEAAGSVSLIFRLPVFASFPIDEILNRIIPKAGWMTVILDKE